MRQFSTVHHAEDKLGLAQLLETFANDQWIGEHYSEEDACALILDRFKRLVLKDLELIDLRVSHDTKS